MSVGFRAKEPTVVERACGGWLACSQEGDTVSIVVEGTSADEARERFQLASERWRQLLRAAETHDRGFSALS